MSFNMIRCFCALGLSMMVILMNGCGENPLGQGSYSLKSFISFAQKIPRPELMNEEEASQSYLRVLLNEFVTRADTIGLEAGILNEDIQILNDSQAIYYRDMVSNPSSEDPEKLETGRTEVLFSYQGDDSSFVDSNVIAIEEWSFEGIQKYSWSQGLKDSVEKKITFTQNSSLGSDRPGTFEVKKWNLSQFKDQGLGDSLFYSIDSLNDALKYQYGSGEYFDQHTGVEHDQSSRTFDLQLVLVHQNTSEAAKPYEEYGDNEAVMSFKFIYSEGAEDIPLEFDLRFEPNHQREGEIFKRVKGELVLVASFTYDEKSEEGKTLWYDESGNVIDRFE